MKEKRKNIITIFIIGIVILLAILLVYKLTHKSRLYELTYNEVMKKIENEETFILCISRTTCSHCHDFKPKLEAITIKYDLDIYYIDIDLYSEEEQKEFASRLSFDGSTPTTLFLTNGKETTTSNRINGDVSTKNIVSKLKKNGFIEGSSESLSTSI